MLTTTTIIAAIDGLAEDIFDNAQAKGFWPEGGRNFGECIALVHSELSEALEKHRKKTGAAPDEHCPEFDGVTIEFADVIIRLLDMAVGFGYQNIGEAIIAKHEFNKTRPALHGKRY